ncbi:fused DSP-PTPase phosphatase/NAD kinase-like protein [Limnoglobus roseus]|nr:hypothetical protein [Limnoglobus roseus]
MTRRLLFLTLLPALALGSAGCRHCCKRSSAPTYIEAPARDRDILIPPPTGGLPSQRTLPADPGLPPPAISSEPSGSRYRPSRETLYPDALLESPAIPPKGSGEPPPVLPLGEGVSSKSLSPAGYADRTNSPTGLPGYAVVSDRIATGRKPTVEGFDRLRATGYKTVVYLHDSDKDVSATKELAEKKGLTFIGIPTTPGTLKAAFSKFAETVGDRANRPAYVFDDDGIRTGSLWYLYFRTVESFSDDTAQVKAAPLGLRDAQGEEKTKFWLAVQDYLSKR